MSPTIQFVLASASPRRSTYLREAGYHFEIASADVEELPALGETPLQYALRVAQAKAQAVQRRYSHLPILAADTDVALDGRVLGKPSDALEAHHMLTALAGRSHEVISAVALLYQGRMEVVHSTTTVQFTALSATQIAEYIATGEPFGKAGSYAIQGFFARYVLALQGSYTGVVGLPLAETCELLERMAIYPASRTLPVHSGL